MYRIFAILVLVNIAGCGPRLHLAGPDNQTAKPADTIVLETKQSADSSFSGIADHLVGKEYSVNQMNEKYGRIKMEPESFEYGKIILSLKVEGNQETSEIRVSGEMDAHNVTRQDVISDMISKRTVEIKRTPMGRSEMRAAWLKMKKDVIDYPHKKVRYVRD